MFKRLALLITIAALFIFQTFSGTAIAAELDDATRTVQLNEAGDTYTLSLEEVARGRRLFNYACGACHLNGVTKTDPNVGLDPESLALATPRRDSIDALIDYMKNPTTFDGQTEIPELHPSLKSSDIFPKMRNLSTEDLKAIAGHIMLQPKVAGEKWGGGKVYF
jgi:photosystem II cytochrome c550